MKAYGSQELVHKLTMKGLVCGSTSAHMLRWLSTSVVNGQGLIRCQRNGFASLDICLMLGPRPHVIAMLILSVLTV